MQTVNKPNTLSHTHPAEIRLAVNLADLLSAIKASESCTGVDFKPAFDQAIKGTSLIAQEASLDAARVVAVAFEIHATQSEWFLPANTEKFDIESAKERIRLRVTADLN